jgi:two-component system sensor histidine kinase BaeS
MRARFMTRMAIFAFIAFTMFSVFVWLVVSVLTGLFGLVTGGSPSPFIVIGGILLVFFIFFGAGGARRLARPIGDLIDAAERVEHGDYTTRLRARGPREVRSLANAFNAMSARLERSETERRRLLADVTHELRTPLTVIQGNLEALIDGVHPADEEHFRAILQETHVLSRLIDDLRTVSVAEAGALPLHRETTDLGALARETVASFAGAAATGGVTFAVETAGNLSVSIDPIRIREVLTNVIANALRYTPAGGRITVRATGYEHEVSVAVIDTGTGVAPDVLPHLFERFTRSPESPGAGLGLAIAKSLVAAHGGTIDATSEPGHGTEVRFTLPRDTQG